MDREKKSWKWRWLTMTVLLIVAISTNLFYRVHSTRMIQHENSILSNVILHTEVDAAIFHLRIDEFASGEEGVENKDAMTGMNRAIGRVDAILRGEAIDGESVSGTVALLQLQKQLEELKSQLVEFRRIGVWRMEDVVARGVESAADQQFDEQFDLILNKATAIEEVCNRNRAENLIKSKRLVLTTYLVWVFTMIAAAAGMWKMERNRNNAAIT
jgi:hypothetical protein